MKFSAMPLPYALPGFWILLSLALSWMFPAVLPCGGIWKTDRDHSHVIPSGGAKYTQCDYTGISLQQTPNDIRSDTEFITLKSNELDDDSLNMSIIRSQVDHLLGIDLQRNAFKQIPGDLNLFNLSLTYLNLERNDLTFVDFNYFSIFPNLRTLALQSNKISSFNLSQPITVVILTLAGNDLIAVDLNDFSFTANLQTLSLSSNPLVNITFPSNTEDLATLKVLTLSSVRLTFWNFDINNLPGLTRLHLIANKLTILDLSKFTNLPNLDLLYLSENQFQTVKPLQFNSTLAKLQNLYLAESQIEGQFNLTFLASDALPNLKVLLLKSNKITSLFLEPGKSLGSLIDLHLGDNKIIHVDLDFFIRSAPVLKTLDLKTNTLTQITFPANGTYHPTLESLSLSNNPLTTVEDYCLPYFNSDSHTFTIELDNTHLRCDACLLWLVTCPYNVYIPGPVCTSPVGLKGETITSVASSLADFPCESKRDESSLFVKNTSPENSQPVASMKIIRGQQACAHRTKLSGASSFTYEDTSQTCHMYHDNTGQFVVNQM